MKRIFALCFWVAVAMLSAGSALGQTVTWTNPTTYTDNTAISAAAQATITTRLFYDVDQLGTPTLFATVTNGVTTWTGALPTACAAKGFTCYYTATASIPAEGDVQSAYAPYVSYTVPYVAPLTPTSITITR